MIIYTNWAFPGWPLPSFMSKARIGHTPDTDMHTTVFTQCYSPHHVQKMKSNSSKLDARHLNKLNLKHTITKAVHAEENSFANNGHMRESTDTCEWNARAWSSARRTHMETVLQKIGSMRRWRPQYSVPSTTATKSDRKTINLPKASETEHATINMVPNLEYWCQSCSHCRYSLSHLFYY